MHSVRRRGLRETLAWLATFSLIGVAVSLATSTAASALGVPVAPPLVWISVDVYSKTVTVAGRTITIVVDPDGIQGIDITLDYDPGLLTSSPRRAASCATFPTAAIAPRFSGSRAR